MAITRKNAMYIRETDNTQVSLEVAGLGSENFPNWIVFYLDKCHDRYSGNKLEEDVKKLRTYGPFSVSTSHSSNIKEYFTYYFKTNLQRFLDLLSFLSHFINSQGDHSWEKKQKTSFFFFFFLPDSLHLFGITFHRTHFAVFVVWPFDQLVILQFVHLYS